MTEKVVEITPSRETLEAALVRSIPSLYRTALRRLHNPADAQDALQEALLSAYKHLDQFQGRSDIATWLTRIVINSSSGSLRRSLAHPALSIEATAGEGRQWVDRGLNPEALCQKTEQRETLMRLVNRLTPALRDAYQLCEIEGRSTREAARILGIRPGAMKCRVFRARTQLIEWLRDMLTPGEARPLAA